MKKIIYTVFILLVFVTVCKGEPIPQRQEPASADSPYYMDSDNILREKNAEDDNSQTEDDIQQTDTIENKSDNNAEPAPDKSNDREAEPVMRDIEPEDNPINNDASEDNINNGDFRPPMRMDEPDSDTMAPPPKHEKKIKRKRKPPKHGMKPPKKGPEAPPAANQNENPENEAQKIENPQPKKYSQSDYEQMYRDMPVPTFTFVHGVDPDQYYDMKDSSWSPYPLFRLNAPLYFKTIVIPPGYYLLTPRQYKGDWYILFKEAGVVKYTIPVFAKDYTAEFYYQDSLKELDMKKSQRWQIKFLNAWGKYDRKSKRKPATKTNIELTDLDNNFLLIDFYYGSYKYSTIFRTEKF